jgi:hypothetical protein
LFVCCFVHNVRAFLKTPVLSVFRSFSPTPRGLEFHPGHDYFFVSTSTPGDLYLRSGGACRSHNMKVTFKVADNRAAGQQQQQHLPAAVNSPRRSILPLSSSDDDDDDALSEEDAEEDMINRSINSNNAYVRPIEDTRTFRSGLDQLYGGGGSSEAAHRRDGGGWREQGGKHLPSTLSQGCLSSSSSLLVVLSGLLFLLRLP